MVEKAVRMSITGRPGPVYLEFPGDILATPVDGDAFNYLPLYKELPVS